MLCRRGTPILLLRSLLLTVFYTKHSNTVCGLNSDQPLRSISKSRLFRREPLALLPEKGNSTDGFIGLEETSTKRTDWASRERAASQCDWSKGTWVATEAMETAKQMHEFLQAQKGSDCKWATCEDTLKPPFWKWQPEQVAYPGCSAWRSITDEGGAEEFCRRLPGNILMVGDSLSHQMVLSLAAMLNATHSILDPKVHKDDQDEWSICGSRGITLKHVRNDYLSLNAEPKSSRGHANNVAWKHLLKSTHVLVLNSGAHHLPENDYVHAMCDVGAVFGGAGFLCPNRSFNALFSLRGQDGIDRVERYAKVIHASLPRGAVAFWRNTVPGHANCDKTRLAAPFISLEEAERATRSNQWYNGNSEFTAANSISARIFRAAGFRIIDAYSATLRRRDRHKGTSATAKGPVEDCLHYCIPGPIDHWNDLLFNLL